MLTPFPLDNDTLIEQLQLAYQLSIRQLHFMPIGADPDTRVYQLETSDQQRWWLKIRRGVVPAVTLAIPAWLANAHLPVIAPLPTISGHLSVAHAGYTLMISPWVTGQNGWKQPLSTEQWLLFGQTLSQIHCMRVPPELLAGLTCEDYTPYWRVRVRDYLDRFSHDQLADPISASLADLIITHQTSIAFMLDRADYFAQHLISNPPPYCLCHGDIHAGNLLLDQHGKLFVVDWDTLILAPKERDLMFIGAGIGGVWWDQREIAAFYAGYGTVALNQGALRYYRYERIVQDIAVYCEQILDHTSPTAERQHNLALLASQFEPGHEVDLAQRNDRDSLILAY